MRYTHIARWNMPHTYTSVSRTHEDGNSKYQNVSLNEHSLVGQGWQRLWRPWCPHWTQSSSALAPCSLTMSTAWPSGLRWVQRTDPSICSFRCSCWIATPFWEGWIENGEDTQRGMTSGLRPPPFVYKWIVHFYHNVPYAGSRGSKGPRSARRGSVS